MLRLDNYFNRALPPTQTYLPSCFIRVINAYFLLGKSSYATYSLYITTFFVWLICLVEDVSVVYKDDQSTLHAMMLLLFAVTRLHKPNNVVQGLTEVQIYPVKFITNTNVITTMGRFVFFATQAYTNIISFYPACSYTEIDTCNMQVHLCI